MLKTMVIIPCFNEANRLDVAAFEEFASAHPDIHLLFSNDGSTDATEAMLKEMCAHSPDQLAFVSLPENRGKAEAVRFAMCHAFEQGADLVGFWDADLATPLGDILNFRDIFRTRPRLLAVFGSRINLLGRDVNRHLLRHYVGRVFATAATAVLRIPIYDTQCGAKLFRNTPEVREAFESEFLSSWIFDVEVIARLMKVVRASQPGIEPGQLIFEYPLMTWHDVAGSKLKLRDFATVGIDLCRIWMKYPRPTRSRSLQ